jgi:hypothetical protein
MARSIGGTKGRDDAAAKAPTDAFFADLGERGQEPLLRSVSGTLRWDLLDGPRVEHWYVTIRKGDVHVSHKNAKADAIVRLEKAIFDGMATGTVNAMAAALRGELTGGGDLGLVMHFQRLFPSPPAGAARAATARGATTHE